MKDDIVMNDDRRKEAMEQQHICYAVYIRLVQVR